MKICSNFPGHMTICPCMVKNIKNLVFCKEEADDDLETWYTASGT